MAPAGWSATSPMSRSSLAATRSSSPTSTSCSTPARRDRRQRPGRAPRPPGAVHHRPRAGRPAADRALCQPARGRHPRRRRRPGAATQYRYCDPLGPPRRQSDRRFADRRRARLPERGRARARRRAGRAGRRRHQRLGPFRRDAGRPALDPARRARHHQRHRLRFRGPAPRRRAAQMLLRLGDDRPRATITR